MSGDADRVLDQIVAWRNDLVSMSRSNRLLYFAHTKASSVEIVQPDSSYVYQLLEGRKHRLEFYDPPKPGLFDEVDDAGPLAARPRRDDVVAHVRGDGVDLVPATSARLRSIQRSLRRAASQEFLDKGLQSLYVAFGILQWFDSEDESKPCLAPLLLVPVELRSEEVSEPDRLYRLLEEELVINPALALKLESDFGITLPAIDDYEELEPLEIYGDIAVLIRRLRGWEVQDRVVLGRFAFHKDVMYRDLLENQEAIAAHPFVHALVGGVEEVPDYCFEEPPDDRLDELAPPETMHSILDADSSQRKCIWAATQGRSFVMDGPPGTGKSQTIANMIAELIAVGKSVLFVSEKAAALEVVYNRLKEKHLDEYILQLHSHKATRKEVARELGRALEQRLRQPQHMANASVQTLMQRRLELSEYALALNEVREPFGRSLYWTIGRLTQLNEAPASDAAIQLACDFDEPELQSILSKARRLSRAWGPIERGDDFLWCDLVITGMTAAQRKTLDGSLEQVHDLLGGIREESKAVADSLSLPAASSVTEARRTARLLGLLRDPRDTPQNWLTGQALDPVTRALDELANLQGDAQHAEAEVRSALGGGVDLAALVGLNTRLTTALDSLASSYLRFSPAATARPDELQSLLDAWGTTLHHVGEEFPVELMDLYRRFDVDAEPDVGLTRDLLDLLTMSDTADRPPVEWFDSAQLASLREARAALGAMVDSYRGMSARVGSVFNAEVMHLPAADLALRFKTVHTGLGRLKSAYRQDKKLLKNACRLGKVTPEAIAMLDEVAELQALVERLDAHGKEHAAEFGPYYAGTNTDFARVDRAIESAATMLGAVSRRLCLARTLRHLGQGAAIDQETRLQLQILRERLEVLRSFVASMYGLDGRQLDGLEIPRVVASIADGADVLVEILAIVEMVGESHGFVGSVGALRDGLACSDAHQDVLAEATRRAADHRTVLVHRYAGLETDVQALRADAEWANEIVTCLGAPAQTATANALLTVEAPSDRLEQLLGVLDKAAAVASAVFLTPRAEAVLEVMQGEFAEAEDLVVRLIDSMDDIEEWLAFSEARDELMAAGLEQMVNHCLSAALPRGQVVPAIERRILETWVDSVLAQDQKRLGPLRSVDRDSVVGDFRDLDSEFVRLAAGGIMEACNARRPRAAIGPVAIIQREAQKQRRHMPIRTLLRQAREVALSVKPCFMMSPLSVSQFLVPEFEFDAVIFDEASQIRPHDAVNCIYRGRQHIIAGDQQQLPPTSFFDTHSDDGDEWQEDQLEQYESVLDKVKASGAVPSMSLKWHYRSRHEDLITFSNYSFYDGRLITFPSPKDPVPPLGIGFRHVAGVYRRGGLRDNLVEAREVAAVVAHYTREYPGLSVGAVAFSEAQETAIQDAIDELRSNDPTLPAAIFSSDRLDGFFVKNLETVQGDERDVIVLSVGYGPDEHGKLTMNFGPINRLGGYRRLNVAVTRARKRLEIVTSIRASDLSAESENEGVRHLRRYLAYAENGLSTLALDGPESLGDVESPFEAEVARVIRSWGYGVVPQVGSAGYRIDLGVKGSGGFGGFALGVECDGAAYHSAKSARDRDRLRQSVLEGLGWKLYRVWGPSWYRQRATEEERLRKAIDDAMKTFEHPPSNVYRTPAVPSPTVVVDDVTLSDGIEDAAWIVDYEVAEPALSKLDRSVLLGDPSAQPILWRVIPEVLAVEQPVHKDPLLDRIRDAWGNHRAGRLMQDNFDTVLKGLKARRQISVDRDGFVSLTGSESMASRGMVRRPTADPRTVRGAQLVPREELNNAVRHCCVTAPGIEHDELSVQVARVFGWGRRGPDVTAAIDRAIAECGIAKTSQGTDFDGSTGRSAAVGGGPRDATFADSAPQLPIASASELGVSDKAELTGMVDSEGARVLAVLRSSREPLSAGEICKALSAQGHAGFDKSLVNSWLYRWKAEGLASRDDSYCWQVL